MSRGSVLIVDPVDDQREMYAEALAHAGFSVLEARTGRDALALVARRRVAVVVTEVGAGRDGGGWELIERLRRSSATERLPIVALGSRDVVSEREQATALDVDAFFATPLLPDALIRTLRELVPPQA